MKTQVAVLWALAAAGAVGCGPGIPGEVLATTQAFSRGLAQDGDRLYWHSEDAVWTVAKTGGEPQALADGQHPLHLTVAGADVCWINRQSGFQVRCVPAAGGEVRELATQADEEFTVRAPAFDGQSLYWSTSAGRIRRVPVAGGEAAVDFAEVDAGSSAVAAEPGALFASVLGGVARFDLASGERTEIAGGAFIVPTAVTLASPPDDFVYWTEVGPSGRDGLVLSVPKGGGDVTLLARRQTLPSDLFVDDAHVYWATGGGTDRIRRIPVAGGREETFAGGDNQVGAPVVDGQSVHWIDPEGRIHRAPK